ncbi:ABC transporter ATP-binding protein [Wenxinia marina]|uniref:Carbohydrate ABC transporter ATP-binding protein, CUT1 family n=1 Tax=Wenxinia marina DSM 24838 TaxID=1123501 RepID=A0A0D0Q721_9RHOB|nr:ABC transporter ATP-binding protein [Wenxinia marina]KIQ68232.1 carbohydrate ABC transporter ATP-binding protein, CUT1 family [Wenxinia marina DSM 24838]GGL76941.1 ABC transporter ATP-binding protein [Wenxinia marina]
MTPQIEISHVEKHYGAFHALKDIDLTIPKGSFVALVGPSGCGKSTLLRSIAGLESITSGDLRIAGERMNEMPPRKRDVAMVFQSYALYPHMNVLGNLTYSLRFKGVAKADAREKANRVASTIGLEKLLDRYPRELSGGQRQRVAMGRAIIREPKAFLFDEPLSNLDAALRVHMRMEVRALHDRLGATSVYVTHDQIEAMTMADHVVVMRDGRIEQQGSPLTLYDTPANRFVAGFIGSPAMNFVDGHGSEDGHSVRLDALPGAPVLPLDRRVEPGRPVVAGLRPEHLFSGGETQFSVPIRVVESTGSIAYYTTDTDPELMLVEQGRGKLRSGDSAALSIAPGDIHLFDPMTGLAL